MSVTRHLSLLALKPLVAGACNMVGGAAAEAAGAAVVGLLVKRFSDHSQRLTHALEQAQERAWKALEIALAGDSFWERCKTGLAPGEERAFRQQVRAFLEAIPQDQLPLAREEFRQRCLEELRTARQSGLLTRLTESPQRLAEEANVFIRFNSPQQLLQAEMKVVEHMTGALKEARLHHLAQLLAPHETPSLLVVSVRYFLGRAIEDDEVLHRQLTFAQMQELGEQQARGLASLQTLLVEQGQRLEGLLQEVQSVVVETHGAVLDIQQELREQGKQNRALYETVLELQRRLEMNQSGELRPRDSLSIRDDQERQLIKEVVGRYRRLPDEQRVQLPALLNAIGKLEVAAGSYEAAERDFATVATLVEDPQAQAAAHYNAYRAALEQRNWEAALVALREVIELDARQFAPFPTDKYQPVRILGAGGFGVAFLCKHRYTGSQVVVKTLLDTELDRRVDQLFAEAQAIQQLNHPSIIRLLDCGYTDDARQARPYLVMEYFEGETLEEYIRKHGTLGPRELLSLAEQMAEALQAAHQKSILHRDVKPGNLLVRRLPGSGAPRWEMRLIDFGLALRQSALRDTSTRTRTLIGTSIAGTLDYAAPEQMGKLPGVSAGPYSDIYGFGKTCCYALFGTTQPVLKHWQSVPEPLADLLGRCLGETPEERPVDFATVLRSVRRLPTLLARDADVITLEPVVLTPVPPPPPPPPAPRQRRSSAERREPVLMTEAPAPSRRRFPVSLLIVGVFLGIGGVVLLGGSMLFGLFSASTRPGPGGGRFHLDPLPPRPAKQDSPVEPLKFTVDDPEESRVYLSDLQEINPHTLAPTWHFGKKGDLGTPFNDRIKVNGGWEAKHGLSMGPPDHGSSVKYKVAARKPILFQTLVGLDDTGKDHPVTFEVLGDGRSLWRSGVIKGARNYEECRVSLAGFKELELRVRPAENKSSPWTRPVWIDPYIVPEDKPTAAPPPPPLPPLVLDEAHKKYLSDLSEIDPQIGPKDWKFGKKGQLGNPENQKIVVRGNTYPEGLSMHPPSAREGSASVIYKLDKKATALKGAVGVADTSTLVSFQSIVFEVLGDGKVLYTSAPLKARESEEFLVDLTGVDTLKLRARVTGGLKEGGHAVWLDPVVYFKPPQK